MNQLEHRMHRNGVRAIVAVGEQTSAHCLGSAGQGSELSLPAPINANREKRDESPAAWSGSLTSGNIANGSVATETSTSVCQAPTNDGETV